MSTLPLLRIGTRGSPLALAQATELRARLAAAHAELADPAAIAIDVIRTTGDAITDRTLAAIGGKGLFTKEIEQALIDGAIDCAVHSMKDVPTFAPDGLVIDCFLPREDPRDAFFSTSGLRLHELPPGAVVGTASLRRQAQILSVRPDLAVVPFRGNVETRLRKLEAGVVDATLLALAGLRRLNATDRITAIMPIEIMLPAVAQGAIGIQRRLRDERVARYLAPLDDPPTSACIRAERAFLGALDGSCKTPIAGLAVLDEAGGISLRGMVIRPDGREFHETMRHGAAADGEMMGEDAGAELRRRAGPGFFDLPVPDGAPL